MSEVYCAYVYVTSLCFTHAGFGLAMSLSRAEDSVK